MTTKVDAIVLAAGSSSRLGRPKQTVELHCTTLLERTLNLAIDAVDGDVHLVLGAHAQTFMPTLCAVLENPRIRPHIFADWQRGQNASLAFGLDKTTPGRAVLVLLVDQYRIQPDDIAHLIEAWRAAPEQPAAASYADTCGVPVLWPPHYVELLGAAPRGQSLLDRATSTLVPLAAAAYDLDTPEHLRELEEFERASAG